MYNMSVYDKQKGMTEWQEDIIVEKDEEIDVRETLSTVITTLLKHKWSIIGLTLIVIAFAYFHIAKMQPVYRSTATLLIEAQPIKAVSIEKVVNERRDDGYYNTQYEILRSRDLAEQVIRRLSLTTHPEFNPTQKTEAEEPLVNIPWPLWLTTRVDSIKDQLQNSSWLSWLQNEQLEDAENQTQEVTPKQLVYAFSRRLSIQPIARSQLVEVGFEAHDPKLAAAVANAVGEVYIEQDQDARVQMTLRASQTLVERLQKLREALESSEEELQAFREREELLDVAGVRTLAARQLEELNAQLLTLEKRVTETKVLYDQLMALQDESVDKLAALPLIMEDSLLQSLKGIEANALKDLSTLSQRYGPRHVKILEAKATLEETRNNIDRHIRFLADKIVKDYEVARANYALLSQAMDEAKEQMQQINRKEYRLSVLTREVSANRELYDLFLRRLKETNIAGDIQFASARIVDSAMEPVNPVRPNKNKYLLLAACFGIGLGVMWAFLREFFDNSLKQVEDLEAKVSCPVLGSLPKLVPGKKAVDTSYVSMFGFRDYPDSQFAESLRTIRTGILLSGYDSAQKMIVVTSSVQGEGKSTFAMNLALALSSAGKVLLIDADLRSPSLAEAWGLDESAVGLSQLASGMNDMSECIYPLPDNPNVLLMPAGFRVPNPFELLSSMRFAGLLVQFNEQFDYVVIDSPPTLPFSDSLILATYANDVVYVVKAESTPYRLVQQGLKKLGTVRASLAGVVLNQANVKDQVVYNYKSLSYSKH